MKHRVVALQVVLCAFIVAVAALPAAAETGPMFDGLVLVDEVICGNPSDPHPMQESVAGISVIQTILGQSCRVLPNINNDAKYFSYKIGQGLGLQAGKAYILTVDYPEDQGRTLFVINGGCETTEGFHTGKTVGDDLHSPAGGKRIEESMNYPLSGEYETWQQLFHLHDHYFEVEEVRGGGDRPMSPADGFWVTIAHLPYDGGPLSQGAAVSRIALYEAPDIATYTMPLNLPRLGLPRRHVSYREEMADGLIKDGNAIDDPLDWWEYKARLMKFLGINTYSKDLLEFGSNQHWDSSKYGGNNWYFMSADAAYWEDIVTMMGQYGFDILPYYEYAGSRGWVGLGSFGRKARPLTDTPDLHYTQISWTEMAYADLTWWETFWDVHKLLDCTIYEMTDLADFVGAWFRNRPSHIPISFSDDALSQFAEEANGGVAITRADLIGSWTLRSTYYTWWFERRKAFLERIRDDLRSYGVSDEAVFLYTTDHQEDGIAHPTADVKVVTDNTGLWTGVETPMSYSEALSSRLHYNGQIAWRSTYSPWEWHHACPPPDPSRYADVDGIVFTWTYNMLHTVSLEEDFDAFRSLSGVSIVRHYGLNEDSMRLATDEDILGYFVSDVNMAGPYGMLAEARAMAYGNPYYIGYLASSNYNRGFPQYVRNFNAAFLALPALPAVELEGATTNYQIVVREIDAGDYGKYYYAVNTGMLSAPAFTITLDYSPTPGTVKNLVTGEDLMVAGNIILAPEMYPGEMLSFRVFSGNEPPGVDAGASNTIQLPETSYTLRGQIADDGPIGNVTHVWSVVQGDGVIIDNDGELETNVTLPGAGTYVLRLTADDGEFQVYDDTTLYVKLPSGPNLLWSHEDLGDGQYGFTFYISNDDEQEAPYTVELGFQGIDGATINQIKYNDSISINSETMATAFDGMGTPPYSKADDSWAYAPFGDNTIAGTNPLTGQPLTGFDESDGDYAMSVHTGFGSEYGTDVNVIYVVADGNLSWTGTIYRMDDPYDTSGETDLDFGTCQGDFNGDGTVTGADYVIWANNFGGGDAALAPGSHNDDGVVTGADYVIWANNFGNTCGG